MKQIGNRLVYTVDDLGRVRKTFHVGEKITIDTRCYSSALSIKKIRVKARIDGVYPHGLMCSFFWRNILGGLTVRRWVPYVEVLMAKSENRVPFIDKGERNDAWGRFTVFI